MTSCDRCGQVEPQPVCQAKLAERGGRVAVVRDVPMQQCPACGHRIMEPADAEALGAMLRRIIDSGAEVGLARWTPADGPAGDRAPARGSST